MVSGEVEKKGLAGRIEEFRSILKAAQRSESLRFHVDGDAVTEVFWEHSKIAGRRDGWSSLNCAIEKSDVIEHYSDPMFPMQLRMLCAASRSDCGSTALLSFYLGTSRYL